MDANAPGLRRCRSAYACWLLLLLAASARVNGQGPLLPGANVSIVRGTSPIDGDPFLQRQNEPSIAVSTRNPCHLLAGANDYRTVDIPDPTPLPNEERRPSTDTTTTQAAVPDAWLGVFQSADCGATWRSTLVPGYPQDVSPEGLASPNHGFGAAADPVVRAGTNGMFFYAGLAFDRTARELEGGSSQIFVQRYIDNNNKERGDTIAYVDTSVVAVGAPGHFVDKPWLAVDRPRGSGDDDDDRRGSGHGDDDDRSGSNGDDPRESDDDGGVCEIGSQRFRAGRVYVAWADFGPIGARLMFARSGDCGRTWHTRVLADDGVTNQGASIAIAPHDGTVYVVWRRFANALFPNSIELAVSRNHGRTFRRTTVASSLNSYDQPKEVNRRFRTNSLPTVAADTAGRVYVAWSERGFAAASGRTDPDTGDARIVIAVSTDRGRSFGERYAVDDTKMDADGFERLGHQIMPALTFTAGRLQILYYDFSDDFSETFREFVDESDPPVTGGIQRRHTVDIRAAHATPAARPMFIPVNITPNGTTPRVTQYRTIVNPDGTTRQVQFNPPNLPLYVTGSTPFIGDYIDVAGLTFTPRGDGWTDNNETGDRRSGRDSRGALPPQPVYHAVWTDHRDVRPPADGDWTFYKAPGDPYWQLPDNVCVPSRAGMRNANIYTSRLSAGLYAGSPGNTKPLGFLSDAKTGRPVQDPITRRRVHLQRGFVVFVQNALTTRKKYLLTIVNQPGDRPGDRASFVRSPQPPYSQADLRQRPFVWLVAEVSPLSTISRTVFVTAADPKAQVRVDVMEVPLDTKVDIGQRLADAPAPVPDGLQMTVPLNPDPTNPAIEDPDFITTDVPILAQETHDPVIFDPVVTAIPNVTRTVIELRNPDESNPDESNPDESNHDEESPDESNPDESNPDESNPDESNPDESNPDESNVGLLNLALGDQPLEIASIVDVQWKVQSRGNTTTAFRFRPSYSGTRDGKSFQLLVTKRYYIPDVDAKTCNLGVRRTNRVLVNISNFEPRNPDESNPDESNPDESNPDESNPDESNPDESNATFFLAPGESATVTLRIYDTTTKIPPPAPELRALEEQVAAEIVSFASNTGEDEPPSDAAGPDLVAFSPVVAPANVGPGGTATVTWTLANRGSEPTPEGTFRTRILLSADTLPSDDDRQLGISTFSGSLRADDPHTEGLDGQVAQAASIAVPPDAIPGTNFIVLATDFDNAVFEADETNNHATGQFGGAFALTFPSGPASVTQGFAVSPAVQVRVIDATGAPASAADVPSVTLALGSRPADGALIGTVTRPNVGGIVTFPGLSVTAPGSGYTLVATATGPGGSVVAPAVSAPFTVEADDPPVAIADIYSTAGEPLVIADPAVGVVANDIDELRAGGPGTPPAERVLRATLVDQADFGTVLLHPDGTFTYTPGPSTDLVDVFTYRLNDGVRDGNATTVKIAVGDGAGNTPPITRPLSIAVAEDSSAAVDVARNSLDADGDTLAASAANAANGQARVVNGTIEYAPHANYFGPDTIDYTITDGKSPPVSGVVSVTVTGVNDNPVARDDEFDVEPDSGAHSFAVLNNDDDGPDSGETLTISRVATPAHGSATFTATSITYTPNAGFEGPDSFSYQISDGNGGVTAAHVRISVGTVVNTPPVAADDLATTPEETPVVVHVIVNDKDADGDAPVVTSVGAPAHGTVSFGPQGARSILYTPPPNFNGTDSFTYTIDDGRGGEDTAAVTVTVGAVNDTPFVSVPLPDQRVLQGAPATTIDLRLHFDDPDIATNDDVLAFAVVENSNSDVVAATISGTTLTLNYGVAGTSQVVIRATDGAEAFVDGSFIVTVEADNNAPPRIVTTALRDAIAAHVYTEPIRTEDGTPPLTWALESGTLPDGLTLGPLGSLNGEPSETGDFSFTVRVTDSRGRFDTQTVRLHVGAVDYHSFADVPLAEISVGSTERVAQIVRATGMGTLYGLRANATCAPGGTLTLEVQGVDPAGLPDGAPLVSDDTGVPLTVTVDPRPFDHVIPLPGRRFTAIGMRLAIVISANVGCSVRMSRIVVADAVVHDGSAWTPITRDGQPYDLAISTVIDPAASMTYFGWLGAHSRATRLFCPPEDSSCSYPERLLFTGFEPGGHLYDVASGTVRRRSDANPFGARRTNHTATRLADGRVLVAGGWDIFDGRDVALASAFIYDPNTDTVIEVGSLNVARWDHAAVLLKNGTVLFTGGVSQVDSNGIRPGVVQVEVFDPATATFTVIGSRPDSRWAHTATLLACTTTQPECAWDGKVLVAGGFTDTFPFDAVVELYDPTANTWEAVPAPPNLSRADHAAARLDDGRVLLAGGFVAGPSGGMTRSSAVYDPAVEPFGAVTVGADLALARRSSTATRLADGSVLIAGGQVTDDFNDTTAALERYIPSTNTFVGAGSLHVIRGHHSAAALADGRVALAGGAGGDLPGRSLELWNPDPATLFAITTTSLPKARVGDPYSQPIGITGGTPPLALSVVHGALPPGLELISDAGTWRIDGVPIAAGTFSFTLQASDPTGRRTVQPLSLVVVDATPLVTIEATDPQASEAGLDPGTFTVTRTGATRSGLSVHYAIGGSAINGADYASLEASVAIPEGVASATITVVPLADAEVEGDETVVLTLQERAEYVIGTPNEATVTIADDVNRVLTCGETASGTFVPGQRDTYTFRANAGDAVSIAAFAGGVPGAIAELWSPSGQRLAGPPNADGRFTFGPLPENGVYRIVVFESGLDTLGTYHVSLQFTVGGECPPSPIVCAETRAGAFETPAAQDHYTFSANAGDAVSIVAFAGGVPAAIAELWTPSGQQVLPTPAADGRSTFGPLPETGVYRILVFEQSFDTVGTYHVSLQFTVGGTCQPSPLVCGETRTETLAVAAEQDHFTFTGTAGQTISAGAVGGGLLATVAELWSPGGQRLASSPADGRFTFGPLVDDGVYRVLVFDNGFDTAGTYTIDYTLVGGCPAGGATLAVDPTTIDFGEQEVAAPSAPAVVAVTNGSAIDLTIESVTSTGDFSLVEDTCTGVLAAGAACAIGVTFNPSVDGERIGEIRIVSSASDSPHVVPLRGIGVRRASIVTIAATDAAAAESDLDPGTFTITRTGDTSLPLPVAFSLGGSAINGVDYQPIPGVENLMVNGSFEDPVIPAGSFQVFAAIPGWQEVGSCSIELQSDLVGRSAEGRQLVELDSFCATTIFQDIATEPDQFYVLRFAFSPRPGVADNRLVVRWDGSVVAELSATGAGLGDTEWQEHTLFVRAASTTARLEFADAGVSDTFGTLIDAVRVARAFVIAAGDASATVTITPIEDVLAEGAESVVVTLQPAGGYTVGDPGTATVTIADNEAMPAITIADASIAEGNDEPVILEFLVSLSNPSTVPVTVNFATQNGTAVAGSDYVAASGTVTFTPGDMSEVIAVTVNADTAVEGDETFSVVLSDPINATLADSSATGTILNDDNDAPGVTIVATDADAAELGNDTATFVITRSGPTTSDRDVEVEITGSARHLFDYAIDGFLPGSRTVRIPAGATSATLTVTVLLDIDVEGPETVILTAEGSSATATIADAQALIVSVTPASGRQGESLDVFVTGSHTNFVQGETTADFGEGITVKGLLVRSPDAVTVSLAIDPAAAIGSKTVTLTTAEQVVSLVGGFSVVAGTPTIVNVNPDVAVAGQSLTVVITGQLTTFTQSVTTADFGGDIVTGTVTVHGPTLVSVPITISTGAFLGARTIFLTTGEEMVGAAFTVLPGTPAITVIEPNTGRPGQTVSVHVTGQFTEWQDGLTVASFGPDTSVGGANEGDFGPVTVTGPNSFSAQLEINGDAPLGPRDVAVRTGDQLLAVAGGFTLTDNDVIPPGILRTSPEFGAVDVPLNAAMTIEFNEPIDRATVDPSQMFLFDNVIGEVVPGSASLDATGRILTFVPSRLLAVGRGYFFQPVGIRDTAGNPYPGFAATVFATGFAVDSTGPSVLRTSPADGMTQVPLNARPEVQFSEPMNVTTRPGGLHVFSGGEPVPGTFTFTPGHRRVAFQPAAPLAPETLYTVTYNTGLTDLAGNALSSPGSVSFMSGTVSDIVNPFVIDVVPVQGATNIGRNVRPRVRFNEPINPIGLERDTFLLSDSNSGQLIGATVEIASDRLSAMLIPDEPLQPHTMYFVSLSSFVWTDLAGNLGFGTFTAFTTGGVDDGAAPVLLSISPADVSSDVPVNAFVRARLSERLDQTSVNNASIVLDPPAAGAVTLGLDGATVTLTPAEALTPATAYTVRVSGLRDQVGNTMEPFSSSFTTSAATTFDLTNPQVLAIDPPSGATGVPVTTAVTVTISERIVDPINEESVPVFVNADGFGFVQVPATYSLNPTGTILTVTPVSPLPGGVAVVVHVNANGTITDLAGNGLFFSFVQFTTADTTDATPPAVLAVTPADGTTDVGPQALVVLTFSEPLNPATIHGGTFALFNGASPLPAAINRSADSRTVALSTNLPFGARISVLVNSGVRDLQGNLLPAFSSRFRTREAFDAQRPGGPAVITQRPGNGATGVPATSSVTLFASERLNAATIPGALHVSQNGVVITGTTEVTGGGQAIHFTPTVPFAPGALIQVFLDASAEDIAGNRLFSYSGQFTIEPDTGPAAPVLLRVSPQTASPVPLNVVVDIEFNEPLDPASVVDPSVRLHEWFTGAFIPSTITLRNGGRVIRLVPRAPLNPETLHVVQIQAGALRDLEGVPYPFSPAFFFTTGSTADGLGPTVIAITPPPDSVDIGINALLRLRFNEPVNPITVSDATIRVNGAARALRAATISFDPTNGHVTLTPLEPLPDDAEVIVVIEGVEDLAGNTVAPLTSSFRTRTGADFDPPQVSRTSVFNGQTEVPINTTFSVEFNEPIDRQAALAGGILLQDNVTGAAVPATSELSADGRTVTLAPTAPLAVGRSHTFFAFNVQDVAGNGAFFFVGIASFTTTFAADVTAPQVVVTNPMDGSTGTPLNLQVQVRFDEPVQPTSVDDIRLLANAVVVPTTTALSDGNRIVTLTPRELLAGATEHVLSISGVADTSGNTLSGTVTAAFTTGTDFDLVSPFVTVVAPTSGAAGVGLNIRPRVVFSEPINPAGLTSDTFLISDANTGRRVSASVVVAADRRGATLLPDEPLEPDTMYFVQLLSFTWVDLAGNGGFGMFSSFTTGGVTDETRPEVASIAPPDGMADVAVNAPIRVRLNELVDPGSVSSAAIVLTPATPGAVALVNDGVTITLTPASPLTPATLYTIRVSELRDLVGNEMTPFISTFTTSAVAAPDHTPPFVQAISPESGSSGVPVTTAITVTFSEPVVGRLDTESVPVAALTPDLGFVQVAANYALDASRTVLTIVPTSPLPGGVLVHVAVNNNSLITDVAGNTLVFSVSQFTTANTTDETRPEVIAVMPADGTIDVGPQAQVVLTFSEPLNPLTVNHLTFALFNGSALMSPSITRSADNRTVVLSTTLPFRSVITVAVTSGVSDLAGNSLSEFSSAFTTKAAVDPEKPGAPVIITQRPGNGATGVPVASSVTLYANEPLDSATIAPALHVAQNGSLVDGTTEVTGNGQAFQFTPSAPFAPGAVVQVFLDSNARDVAGNRLSSYGGQFTIEVDTTAAAPVLVRAPGGTLARNAVLELEFSEPLDPTTVVEENVSVHEWNTGVLVPSTITLRHGGRVIRLVPLTLLQPETLYYVNVPGGGLRDLQGTPYPFSHTFLFMTSAATDEVAPTVTAVTPPHGATNVGVNALLRVTFSEPINPLTVSGTTIEVTAGGRTLTPSSITFDLENRAVTLTPLEPLADSAEIAVVIEGVEDLAGNPVVPLTATFTTRTGPDVDAPFVTGSSVFHGQQDVPVNSVFTTEFNEPMDAQPALDPANVVLFDQHTGIRTPATLELSPDGRTLTIAPTEPLVPNHLYALQAFNIRDLAGNSSFFGLSTSFVTAAADDVAPPRVVATNPANGQQNVPRNAQLQIRFDEPVQTTRLRVRVSAGGIDVATTRAPSDGNRVLTLTPHAPLAAGAEYTISIDEARDTAGNPLAGGHVATFTTRPGVDLVGPSPQTFSPIEGATDVPTDTRVEVTFDEAVNAVSAFSPGSVMLRVTNTGEPVPAIVGFSADMRTIVLTPSSPLSPATRYTITAGFEVTDLAGNRLRFGMSSTFTTQ